MFQFGLNLSPSIILKATHHVNVAKIRAAIDALKGPVDCCSKRDSIMLFVQNFKSIKTGAREKATKEFEDLVIQIFKDLTQEVLPYYD